MKIILTPNDQAVAIQAYLIDNYNITTYIDESKLEDMHLDLAPTWSQEDEEKESNSITADLEDDREWALTRAEELGLNFRSDIKTATLITRIEEAEDIIATKAMAGTATWQPVPTSNPLPTHVVGELHSGNDEELKPYEETESEEKVEAVDEEQEETEVVVSARKKPSIFPTK